MEIFKRFSLSGTRQWTLPALATNYWLRFLPTPLIFIASALAFFWYVFMRYRSRILTGMLTR